MKFPHYQYSRTIGRQIGLLADKKKKKKNGGQKAECHFVENKGYFWRKVKKVRKEESVKQVRET